MLKFFIAILFLVPFGDLAIARSHRNDVSRQDKTREQIQSALDEKLAELSRLIANKIEAGQKRSIAVLEFTDLRGNVTDFGRYLAEELITRLYDSNKFKVVERQLLNKVIAEQKLSLTGMVDPVTAKKLGSVLGVDAIVSGTIADRGDSLKVNARLISTETGEIFSAAAIDMNKDREVQALIAGPRTSEPRTQPTGERTPARSGQQLKAGDFKFVLSGCTRSEEKISCALSISNYATEDRHLTLYGNYNRDSRYSSRLIDADGNEYYPASLRLGSGSSSSRQSQELLMVTKVPITASLEFEGVSPKVSSIRLLRIRFTQRSMTFRTTSVYADFNTISIE